MDLQRAALAERAGESTPKVRAAHRDLRIGLFSLPYWFHARDERIDSSPTSYPSLTVPYLVGHLSSAGYDRVRHYDLELIFQRFLRRNWKAVDLAYLTPENANLYLTTGHDGVGRFMERLVAAARISPADLFGLSLSLQDCEGEVGPPAISMALCLVRYLKRRFPDCRIVIGGLVMREQTAVRSHLSDMLARCPELDWAVEGPGEGALLRIAAATLDGGVPGEDPAILRRAPERAASSTASAAPLVRVHSKSVAKKNEQAPVVTPIFQWAEERRTSGAYLADLYALSEPTRELCAHGMTNEVLPVTFRFMDGCSNRCAYCRWSDMAVVASPVQDVVRAIGKMVDRYGTNGFIFMNTCLNWSHEYALSFARELRRANLGILWTDSISFARLDEQLIEALRESGFCRADMGAETASDRLAKLHNKALTYKGMVQTLKLLNDYGIFTYLNMIAGLPGETEDDIQITLDFIRATADYANGYIVNAFYVHEESRLGLEPSRFGVEVLGDGRVTEQGLRIPYSVQGRDFDELRSTALETRQRLYAEIERVQGGIFDDLLIHYHLIFWLYDLFGHGNKKTITDVIKEAVVRQQNADHRARESQELGNIGDPLEASAPSVEKADSGVPPEVHGPATDDSISRPAAPPAPALSLSPPLETLLERLKANAVELDLPGLSIIHTGPRPDDVVDVTMELAGVTLPFGVTLAQPGKPAFFTGQLLSIFHYEIDGRWPEALPLAAKSLCRALEEAIASNSVGDSSS